MQRLYDEAFYLATHGFTSINVNTESMDDFSDFQYLPLVIKNADGEQFLIEVFLNGNADIAEFDWYRFTGDVTEEHYAIESSGNVKVVNPLNADTITDTATAIVTDLNDE